MEDGTQVKDIAKKVDYPLFKKGLKLDENITNSHSLSSREGVDLELSQMIALNIEDEAEAIGSYNKLLLCKSLSEEDRIQIEEIISDEKNHLQVLQDMLNKYDGGIPTAED